MLDRAPGFRVPQDASGPQDAMALARFRRRAHRKRVGGEILLLLCPALPAEKVRGREGGEHPLESGVIYLFLDQGPTARNKMTEVHISPANTGRLPVELLLSRSVSDVADGGGFLASAANSGRFLPDLLA